MGLVKNMLEKVGLFVEDTKSVELLHVYDLAEWSQARMRELAEQHNLREEIQQYVRKLGEKRWLLECKLDDWEERSAHKREGNISSLFQQVRDVLEQITFPEKTSVTHILKVHLALERELERLYTLIEEHPFHQRYSFVLSDEERTTTTVNPLLKELFELNGIRDQFQRTMASSGFSIIHTLTQKAGVIEQYTDSLKSLSQDISVKSKKLRRFMVITNERQGDLRSLQHDPRYEQHKDDEELNLPKDFRLRIEEARYRAEHFQDQASKLRLEVEELEQAFRETDTSRHEEIERFKDLVKVALDKGIEIKT